GATVEQRGGRPTIVSYAVEPLPAGALTASLTSANIQDRAVVSAALESVLERIGRPRQIALVVPDPVSKVSLVKFERGPSRAADLDQLIRWQGKKSAPFPIEDAQVTYAAGQRLADGQEFIVSIAKREVVREFEELCAGAGAHAGIVDLATF